jgi:hypothetical protein
MYKNYEHMEIKKLRYVGYLIRVWKQEFNTDFCFRSEMGRKRKIKSVMQNNNFKNDIK